MIDAYGNAKENLPFCKSDSLVCSNVGESFQNPVEFCNAMGYKVKVSK